MSNFNDDDEEDGSLDFSQYIPKWKSDDDDEGDDAEEFFYNEELFNDLDPEEVITRIHESEEIKVKHVKQALDNLVNSKNTHGPFTKEEIASELQLVLINEALQELLSKGLVEEKDGKFSLTEAGRKLAQEKSNHATDWFID